MSRPRQNKLPKYLEFNTPTQSYYYKNPSMQRKASLGASSTSAIQIAKVLNSKYRIQVEQRATRLEAVVDYGSPRFDAALTAFVDKYITDYRLKSTTAALLRQRRQRLGRHLGDVQVAAIDTHMLRESIACSSQFEQGTAIYRVAPRWMQWLLALRRVDLVNLRFEDVVSGRIISPIRKTDTEAREPRVH